MGTINAIMPYYGAKRAMAARIVEVIGQHTAYVEPFCGSMAVLLAKPRSRTEIVNDLNGLLINLARVLQNEESAKRLFHRCVFTLYCGDLVAEADQWLEDNWRDGEDVDQELADEAAYRYVVREWMGRNGLCGTKNRGVGLSYRFTLNGGDAVTRWQSMSRSILRWHRRMRGVQIWNRDAFEILGRYEDTDRVAMYVDPPYVAKVGKYIHDFDSDDDHRRLATELDRFGRATIVLSYYDHPLIRELYPAHRWEWIDCRTNKAMSNTNSLGASSSAKAPEVLIVRRGATR